MTGAFSLPELCRFFKSTIDADGYDDDSLQEFDSRTRIEDFVLTTVFASASILTFDGYSILDVGKLRNSAAGSSFADCFFQYSLKISQDVLQ